MVKIRLRRVGAKKQPHYRVVVADSRSPRDGRFIETIGNYNPRTEPPTMEIDAERALHWLGVGAQPSEAVKRMLDKLGITARAEAIKRGEVPGEPVSPEETEAEEEQPEVSEEAEADEEEAPEEAEGEETEAEVEAEAEEEALEEEEAEPEDEDVPAEAEEDSSEEDTESEPEEETGEDEPPDAETEAEPEEEPEPDETEPDEEEPDETEPAEEE